MKTIRKELGEAEDNTEVGGEYTRKIEASAMPEEARREALRELKRLQVMEPHASEYAVIMKSISKNCPTRSGSP